MATLPLKKSALLWSAGALVVAGGCAWGSFYLLDSWRSQMVAAHSAEPKMSVVVALHDLPRGELVTADAVGMQQISLQLEADRAIYGKVEEVVGQVPTERILAGELLRAERFQLASDGMPADLLITAGTRALTLDLDRDAGVGGLLEPGFYVDLIVTIRTEGTAAAPEWVTETVAQGVRVLAIQDGVAAVRADRPDAALAQPISGRAPLLVTLELDPEEAEKVSLARSRGEIQLVLRGRDDLQILPQDRPLVTSALVGVPPTTAKVTETRVATVRRSVATVAPNVRAEVVVGGKVVVEEFTSDGRRVENGPNGRGR